MLSDLKGLAHSPLRLDRPEPLPDPQPPAQTTRGCPYACSYCEVTQVYGASSDTALRGSRRGSTHTDEAGRRKFVYFVDDIFNAHRKHAFAVMELLHRSTYDGPVFAPQTSAMTARCSTS